MADDLRLVAAVLAKDRKATAEFVERYSDSIYAYVRRRVVPRADVAEDLVQETFLAAWQSLTKFRGESGLRDWLLGIARHKVEDYYRRQLREVALSEPDDAPSEPAVAPLRQDWIDRATEQEKIQRVLSKLPQTYALVLLWRYKEDHSLREMAQLAGKTEKAMERLLARAREQFRRTWNHEQP